MRRSLLAGLLLCGMALAVSGADEPKPAKAQPVEIPYRLTVPKHIMVRAKINGKGPFNFILDTGAPALFLATNIGEKLGLKADKSGWTNFERLEIEGGLVIENAKGIVQTPFQLEGMNGMGLAGAELHGMIGYNILARYRMEIDFTRDKMVWTPLDWTPELPMRANGGKGGGAGGLEMMGGIMKTLGGMMGRKATPDFILRPNFGVELVEVAGKDEVRVQNVFADGPAQKGGLQKGDLITKVKGRTITDIADFERLTQKAKKGDKVELTVERGGDKKTITLEAGEGL
jgi:hypothetical protein